MKDIEFYKYRGTRTIYEVFCGNIEANMLLEIYHIHTIFDKCIDALSSKEFINSLSNNYIYTNWNFNNKEKICEEYKNENIYIPIYIKAKNDNTDNNMLSIIDKNESPNKIKIIINKSFVRDNYKYDLKHELTHALQMYIVSDYNPIANEKTKINIEEEIDIINKLYISESMIKNFNGLIYYASKSEQDAHINATISFLKDKNIEITKAIADDIVDLVKFSSEYNGLFKFRYYYEIIENWFRSFSKTQIGYLNNLYIFSYFYIKYSGDKNVKNMKLTQENVMNYKNVSFEDKEKIANKIFEVIMNNYENYQKKLYKIIFMHCISK